MKLGAAVWPFQWQPPYEDAVRRIAGLGFRAVELIAWDGEALASYYTPARIRELRTMLGELGLELSEFVSTAAGMVSPEVVQGQTMPHGQCSKYVPDSSQAISTPVRWALGPLMGPVTRSPANGPVVGFVITFG